jgi:hypothetical protein
LSPSSNSCLWSSSYFGSLDMLAYVLCCIGMCWKNGIDVRWEIKELPWIVLDCKSLTASVNARLRCLPQLPHFPQLRGIWSLQ